MKLQFGSCRSLVVSQEILHTRDIFLIHHTDCGKLMDHARSVDLQQYDMRNASMSGPRANKHSLYTLTTYTWRGCFADATCANISASQVHSRVRRDCQTVVLPNQSHSDLCLFASRGNFCETFLTPQANLTWISTQATRAHQPPSKSQQSLHINFHMHTCQ